MPPNSEIEKLERRWRDNPKGTVFAPYAEVLRKNGDHLLARDVLRQGLELHPDHIPGNIVLGRCCLDLGEDGPAEAAFAHVLDLDPENVIALKALGDITERQGRLAEANNWLSRLISVDPSNDEARDQFTRVSAAREAAARVLSSEFMTREETPAASSVAPTVEVLLTPRGEPAPAPEVQDRAEAGAGEIDDVSDVAAFADEALDSFLDQSAAAPPEGRVLPEAEAKAAPVTPLFTPEPAPISDLEPVVLDLSGATREVAPLAGLDVDEGFVPPTAEPPARPSGPFTIGVEETVAEIEIRPAGASEFQAPDDSTSLLDLSPGKSEFQVPDATSDLQLSTGGKSEFQSPDASEELRFSGQGSSEFQTPSGADELLESAARAGAAAPPEPIVEARDSWNTEPPDSLAALAAMPTQELSTEPPAEPPVGKSLVSAPSWLFDDTQEQAALAPDIPLIIPEPEPEPVAQAPAPPEPKPEPEPEPVAAVPQPVAEAENRSSAELKLIFPDDAAQPEPHRVRRITQADLASPQAEEAPEPAIGEPEPILTETMAELYARQGHAAEALRVYRALAERQPGDVHLRDRIRELEARNAGAPRRHTYVAVDTGGESVESFFRSLADARPGSGGAVSGFDQGAPAEDNSGAPTRPARDPLSLSAIFGEEPAASAPRSVSDGLAPAKPVNGPDAFSFDQFFGGPGSSSQSSSPARPSGASEEDLDQFQNWLKSLKR
jgi:tetratricopeptide (TPR) repeat protein